MDILKEYESILKTTTMIEAINIVCDNIEDDRVDKIKELTIKFSEEEFKKYEGLLFRKLINKKREYDISKRICEIQVLQADTFTDLNKVFTKLSDDKLQEGINKLGNLKVTLEP